MEQAFLSAGDIRVQVGLSLNECRECVRNGDLQGLADQTRFLVVIASPHIEDLEDEELRIGMPPENDADAENTFFEACMKVQRKVLKILASKHIYAYVQPKRDDASDLGE